MILPLLLVLLPVLLSGESAQAADWQSGGFFKSLNLLLQAPPGGGFPSGEVSSNRLRLELDGTVGTGVAVELAAENLLLYTDPGGLLPLPRASANRALDLEKNWSEGEGFQDQLLVDRLSLKANRLGLEWTLGRQAIGFGRIALFSPLDVIAPFPPDALDTEVRPGVDAVRGVRYFGLAGQFGAVAVFGDGAERSSFLATFTHNLRGVDILALAGSLRQRPLAGAGLAGSLGGLGLKAEAALYRGRDAGEPGGDLHGSFAIAALEAWYRFDNGLVLLAEYLYNGPGVDGPADYPKAAASAPFREGLSFLLGRHYLLLAPAYELHPLVTLDALLIHNLEDGSFLLRPLVDLSLADSLDLQLFWTFTAGESPRRRFGAPLPRSEFGSAGDSGGVFIKLYF